MTRAERVQLDAQVAVIWRRCLNYGQLERAAGVTDRLALWVGKSEDVVRELLVELIRGRVRSGELSADTFHPEFPAPKKK